MPRNALPECQLNIAYKAREESDKGCECGALSLWNFHTPQMVDWLTHQLVGSGSATACLPAWLYGCLSSWWSKPIKAACRTSWKPGQIPDSRSRSRSGSTRSWRWCRIQYASECDALHMSPEKDAHTHARGECHMLHAAYCILHTAACMQFAQFCSTSAQIFANSPPTRYPLPQVFRPPRNARADATKGGPIENLWLVTNILIMADSLSRRRQSKLTFVRMQPCENWFPIFPSASLKPVPIKTFELDQQPVETWISDLRND